MDMTQAYQNRVVKTGSVRAGDVLANPGNWRIHPVHQQDALAGVLGSVGWVAGVLINLRGDPAWGRDQGVETLVDGHARVLQALKLSDDEMVPATWVDLDPAEEALCLATLDSIATMAELDPAALGRLVADIPPADIGAVDRLLAELGDMATGFDGGARGAADAGAGSTESEQTYYGQNVKAVVLYLDSIAHAQLVQRLNAIGADTGDSSLSEVVQRVVSGYAGASMARKLEIVR